MKELAEQVQEATGDSIEVAFGDQGYTGRRGFCAECGAALEGDVTVSLPAMEAEGDEHDEFPFPHDELEPGQS